MCGYKSTKKMEVRMNKAVAFDSGNWPVRILMISSQWAKMATVRVLFH